MNQISSTVMFFVAPALIFALAAWTVVKKPRLRIWAATVACVSLVWLTYFSGYLVALGQSGKLRALPRPTQASIEKELMAFTGRGAKEIVGVDGAATDQSAGYMIRYWILGMYPIDCYYHSDGRLVKIVDTFD